MRKPRIKINNEIYFGNYQDEKINERLKKGRISSKLAIILVTNNIGGIDHE